LGWTTLADLLTALVRAVGEDRLAELPVAQRRAADVILLRSPPDQLPVPLDPRLAGSVLLSVLRMLPDSVIAVDDLQWCDAESCDAIGFALRRGDGLNVRWLTSRRPVAEQTLPGEHPITVSPMDAVDLRLVIAGHLSRSLSPALLDEIVRSSGGNPFYALEIV